MRFVRFGPRGQERPGVLKGDGVCVDISGLTDEIDSRAIADLSALTDRIEASLGLPEIDLEGVRLGPPMARPPKIMAIGLNFADHAAEAGMEVPSEPVVFTKAVSSYSGPTDDVVFPRGATKMDWEVELGVVIGQECRYLEDEDAAERAIAGYVVVNDVSERAFQLERGGQWVKGKSADTFTPTGPWLVTADEIGDPLALGMRLSVNGSLRQNGSTSTMIFPPAECVRYLSHFMSLEAGDLILTGTPPGVGLSTGEYLEVGDVMELEIDGLGKQRQRCVEEKKR